MLVLLEQEKGNEKEHYGVLTMCQAQAQPFTWIISFNPLSSLHYSMK